MNAKRILIDIPWDCRFGRQVRLGIYRYARPGRLWGFANVHSFDDVKVLLRAPDTAGVISMRQPRDYAAQARRRSLPVVGVGVRCAAGGIPVPACVDVDPKALAEMGVEYFTTRGFRNFGMLALDLAFHSRHRGEAFVAAVRRRGLPCDAFDPRKEYPARGKPLSAVAEVSNRIRRWLGGLRRPLAVFCIDDYVGMWLCEVCRLAGFHVPEEIAILGVDDDDMFCGMSYPRLSSIAVPARQVGYRAAHLLDRLLRRRHHHPSRPIRPSLLRPLGVVTRQSTDVVAIEDGRVVEALRFIREHAHEGIRVDDVMAETSLPRRMLERRFRAAANRSPFAEIRRVQVEHVKTLLRQTDKTLEAIAPECGFQGAARMSLAFRKAAGMPPGAYRKMFHNR